MGLKIRKQALNVAVRQLLPSMRVDEPMLSMVATRRSADSLSGAKVPKARQAPLNSSMPATRARISGVIWMVVD